MSRYWQRRKGTPSTGGMPGGLPASVHVLPLGQMPSAVQSRLHVPSADGQ